MTPRLTADMLVAALRKRIGSAGGFATIVHRGDETSGAILVLAHHNGRNPVALERQMGMDGGYAMVATGPQAAENIGQIEEYAARRRQRDPDLWVVEANVADAERFAAETIASG
jgi:hypothetical protein